MCIEKLSSGHGIAIKPRTLCSHAWLSAQDWLWIRGFIARICLLVLCVCQYPWCFSHCDFVVFLHTKYDILFRVVPFVQDGLGYSGFVLYLHMDFKIPFSILVKMVIDIFMGFYWTLKNSWSWPTFPFSMSSLVSPVFAMFIAYVSHFLTTFILF